LPLPITLPNCPWKEKEEKKLNLLNLMNVVFADCRYLRVTMNIGRKENMTHNVPNEVWALGLC
jgi:hypothetical protein